MGIINCLKKIISFIKSIFLSGLFTILPIAFTIFFVTFTYNFIYSFILPLRQFEPYFLQKLPGAEFLLVTVFILLIGVILKSFIVHSIIHYFEHVIGKIPLVRIIYSSAKTLVNFFKVKKTTAGSKKVVLIEYPRRGSYHLAFLLESAEDNYQELIHNHDTTDKNRYCKVFMPTSPNPSTGYFFILPEQDLIHTDITFEEAIKTLVSCGLITPESLNKKIQEKKQHKQK